ncbi:hypothetical protein [Sediminibacillus halophilus]|uniref:Uncharacterized protein n=1 Tax=Sediminibacillus halophilus TaxID=482461 RepID=A0A1G9S260_9BACI|nr:hypothetical protein [Sediminibacillus halophilus]SDM29648.1 hypothetical protein SAMN05216244_2251 [Sediminibacillus halophilus]
MGNDAKLRSIIQEEVESYMKNHLADIAKNYSTELSNENGNSSVKQSGNGIVYVDNTGIAYALALFFYHFMADQYKTDINLEDILSKLNEHTSENRKMFEEVIQSISDNEG